MDYFSACVWGWCEVKYATEVIHTLENIHTHNPGHGREKEQESQLA